MSSRGSVHKAICTAIKKGKHNQALEALLRLRSTESWVLEEVLSMVDGRGRTLLRLAVENKAADVAQTLLEYGASVTEMNCVRGSALHAAVANRDRFMLDLLLAKGAIPWQADGTGRSAMDDAMATNWHDAQARFRNMAPFSGLVQVKHSRLGGLACEYKTCNILLTAHLAFNGPQAEQKPPSGQEHSSQMCLFICQDTDNTKSAIKLWLGDVVAKKSIPRGSHVLLLLRPDHPDPKGSLRWRRDEEGRIAIKFRPVDLSAAAAATLNQLVDCITAASATDTTIPATVAAGTTVTAALPTATAGFGAGEIFQFHAVPAATPTSPRAITSPASRQPLGQAVAGTADATAVQAAAASLPAAAAANGEVISHPVAAGVSLHHPGDPYDALASSSSGSRDGQILQQQYPQQQQQQQQQQQEAAEPGKQRKKWQLPAGADSASVHATATLCHWMPSLPSAASASAACDVSHDDDCMPSAPPFPSPTHQSAQRPVEKASARAPRPWFLGGDSIPTGADGTVQLISNTPSTAAARKGQAVAQGISIGKSAAAASISGGAGMLDAGAAVRRGVEEGRCVICLVAQAQVGFLHHNTVHRAACWQCAQDLTATTRPGGKSGQCRDESRPCCPLCREPIERVLAVY